MKSLVGKAALGLSELVCKPLILWAADFRLRGKRYSRVGSPGSYEREFAVESAEKTIRNAPASEAITDLIALSIALAAISISVGATATLIGVTLVSLLTARLIYGPVRSRKRV